MKKENEVLKTIAERSSIRAYGSQKLTEEEIKQLVTAGLQAPTARNEQEVHISVLDGENPILAEIEQEKRRIMAEENPDRRENIFNAPKNFYYDAPTVFMLSAKKDFSWSKLDAGICAQSICLAAQSMGLGNLMIGIIRSAMEGEKKEYFSKACGIPEGYDFALCVAAGHSNTEKKPHEIDLDGNVTYIR